MSASKWEYDCPQYVDFAASLDEFSPVTDVWFGELNGQQATSPLKLKNKTFGPKMATPRLKPVQSLKNSPFVNTARPIKTDDEKLEMLGKLPRRKSKSDCFLNRIGQKSKVPNKLTMLSAPKHRRSLSDCCIKTKNKMFPATPMCLKRTLNKDKNKKPKTTEELEMDKVHELQSALFQHLRLNEINFKRLKENKAPYLMNKMFDKKIKAKPKILNEHTVKGFQPASRKLNHFKKTSQVGNHGERTASKTDGIQKFKKVGEELQAILNPEPTSKNGSKALRDINIAEDLRSLKKVPFLKCDNYKGLKFFPTENKKTLPHPFSFDKSYNTSQNASFILKENDKLSVSIRTPQLLINKENIHPTNGFHSETKVEKKITKRN